MLSQPVPSPNVLGAKHLENNCEWKVFFLIFYRVISIESSEITSSQIADILVSPFTIRLRTNLTTSSLVSEFQMPSQAKIMNSSSAVIVARLTSGIADIICSSAFRSLFCENRSRNRESMRFCDDVEKVCLLFCMRGRQWRATDSIRHLHVRPR